MDESSLAADEGEYLDPGYDPQTPDGDNQLLDFVRAETALWTSWGARDGRRGRPRRHGRGVGRFGVPRVSSATQ